MTASAASLGAPVTDPGGNVASRASAHPAPGRIRPSTVLTRCTRPGCCSSANSDGTVTEPHSHTRPRSLRTRSTIMTFSARSLSSSDSSSTAVPLIGDERSTSPSRDKKRSGDALATWMPWSGRRTTAENGAGFPEASAAPSAAMSVVVPSGAAGSGALRRRVRLTW